MRCANARESADWYTRMSKLVPYYQPRPPSFRDRLREAVRGYLGPSFVSSSHSGWLSSVPSTATGIAVSEWTALNYAGVFAATNLIASDVSGLPLALLKRLKGGGKEKFDDHNVYRLIHDQPNPDMTSVVWRKTVQGHALMWGNGYSWIRRDGAGRPYAIELLTPDRVSALRSPLGTLQYRVSNPGGADSIVDAADMIHIPGLGFNGVTGYSVIDKARESIGLAMGAERFGGTFYGNGSTFGGIISSPNARPAPEVVENDRRALNSQHQGVDRAHKILALYGGATFQQIGIPPNAAQFLETRKFQVEEIARWFNLPPHKLGILDGSTRANIEQQTVDYYTTTLIPWLRVWEQELTIKLVASSERNIQFVEHNVDGLLRGDSTSRGDFYSKQFSVGGITANEVRESENRNPLPGGDEAFVGLQSLPLSLAKPYWQASIDAMNAKAEADRRPPPTPVAPHDPSKDQQIKALRDELDTARTITQAAEDAMDVAKSECDALRVEWLKTQKALQDETERADSSDGAYRYLTTESVLREANLRADVEATRALATAAEGELNVSQTVLATAHAERDGLRADLVTATAEIARLVSQAEALSLDIIEAQRMTEAAEHRASTADAVIGELRAQLGTVQVQATETAGALVDVRDALARSQTEHETQARQWDTERAATAERLAELDAVKGRVLQTQQALRGVLADTVGRLITRETDRARKAAGSPEKLAKWVEAFYPMHEDVCRMSLKPVVKAWLVASGSDQSVDRYLDRFIPGYLDDSTRQLKGVLIDADHESLGPALEKVLRRWEADRAEATVDKLLREAA